MGESEVELGDVADLVRGVSFRPGELATDATDAVPLLRATNIGAHTLDLADVLYVPMRLVREAQHLRRFDVVIAMSSGSRKAVGRLAPLRQTWDGCVGAFCGVIRPKPDRIDPAYLGYILQSAEFRERIETYAVGTAIMNLSRDRLLGFRFRLPPTGDQRRIAGILGALDDKIELNRRTTETLDATARALFGRWFLSAETSGEWPIEPLAAHLEVIRGLSYKGDGLASTGVPLHNLNSVYEGGGYKPDGIKWYSGPYGERHMVEPGDVIVTNTEQGHDRLLIGHAALVPGSFGRLGLFSHHLYRVRPRPGSVLSRSFVTYLLNSQAMHDLVSGYSNGTTVQMLPVEALQQPAIRIPPASLIRRFDALATISHQRQEIARGEARALAMLRDALLPRLLSGSIEAMA